MCVFALFFTLGSLTHVAFFNQGPDAVHIQQVGQRELKRAPALARRAADIRQKEKQLVEKYNIKGEL